MYMHDFFLYIPYVRVFIYTVHKYTQRQTYIYIYYVNKKRLFWMRLIVWQHYFEHELKG